MITPFFHLDCFIYEPIEKMMESFKEKFKIAKVLASIFTHSSTLEENVQGLLAGKHCLPLSTDGIFCKYKWY